MQINNLSKLKNEKSIIIMSFGFKKVRGCVIFNKVHLPIQITFEKKNHL